MGDAPPFPPVQDGDSDDVRWALETASAMWGQGDSKEALRWLKRAAESAAEAGDDLRSLTLAKSAAELRGDLETVSASQAPPASAPTDSQSATPSRPSVPGRGQASAPVRSSPARRAPPPPAASPSTPAPVSVPPPLSAPPPVPPPPISSPHDSDESRQTLVHHPSKFIPAPRNDALEPDAEDEPPPSSVRSSHPSPPRESAPRAARRAPPERRAPSVRPPTSSRLQAVRVSLQPVGNQPGAFLARVLAEGERPGPGSDEALLVALSSATKLLDGA